MTDRRRHRGPHPEDGDLFADDRLPALRRAVEELSWLWTRGYALPSSLKIVGDRHHLTERQRLAVRRCACSEQQLAARSLKRLPRDAVRGRIVMIDGFNLLTTIESALSGGVLLLGLDGSLRDMASMHGSYRKVLETIPAVERIGRELESLGATGGAWLLDQPVSNSGRLKTILEKAARDFGWDWKVELHSDPDRLLREETEIVATADAGILDECERWIPLARWISESLVPCPRICDLRPLLLPS